MWFEVRERLVTGKPERFVVVESTRDRLRMAWDELRRAFAWVMASGEDCAVERIARHMRGVRYWLRRLLDPVVIEHETRDW